MSKRVDNQPAVPLSAEAWRRVLVVMERLALSSDLDEILSIVIDAMRDCLEADRASVFQYDAARDELIASRAHGVDPTLRIPATRGLAGEAVRTRQIINVPDCQTDTRFNRDVDLRTGYVTRSMLTVPLVSFDGLVEGVAQVLNKRAGGPDATFGRVDEEVARGLASQAAVAMRRARLIDAERRKTQIEAALHIARDIQFAALPPALPVIRGYDLAAHTIPAEETGGDIFDVLELPSEASGPARLLILVADAAGHGVGPALAVTRLQAMLRLAANLRTPITAALEAINRQLCASLPIGRYVAAVVGVLDPAAHAVHTLGAGLSTLFVVAPDGTVQRRDADALALAIDADWVPDAARVEPVPPGGALVVLTDGHPEAMNPENEMFGLQRVEQSLARGLGEAATTPKPAEAIWQRLEDDLAAFVRGRPLGDDRTGVVIYRSA